MSELAEKRNVTMTEIALAWLLTEAASPVAGATKISHVEGAVKSFELVLTEEETAYLEELYIPHALTVSIKVLMPYSDLTIESVTG